MRRLIAPALLALALAGPAAADTRDLSGFREIHSAGKFDVEFTQGDAYSVRVNGSDAADVITRVTGNALRITQRGNSWFGGNRRLDARVVVTAPRIEALSAARGASVRAEGEISAPDLTLSAVQGGALNVASLAADELSLHASQGGAIEASGQCGTVRASASMGGALSADGVNCARAHASASMGGVASVHAREFLDASATMGGAVNVSGHPTQNDTSSMMGGAISIN